MAATESDILRDEQERNNLLRAIASVETARAVSTPGTRHVLENTIENARKRITTLDKKIEEAKVERAAEVQSEVTAAALLAAKEQKLNAEEQGTYRGFLEKSYFTKKDFGKLDEFYTHSYDRLSEGGKDEMSKRIDEGIRRGEFQFNDLSTSVQRNEEEHRAAKAKQNTSMQDKSSKRDNTVDPQETDARVPTAQKIDLGSLSLNGVKLTEVDSAPNAPSIPDMSGVRTAQRSI